MLRIIAAVLLYLSTSFADDNVKNATAEGNYYHEYLTYGDYRLPHYGGYNFGIYGYRRPYDRLMNSGRPHILDCSDGFYDSEILGLTLVIDRKVKCACCAPHRPYMDVIKVPVQHPNYQPYPPPPSPPVYGQPVYAKN